MIGYLEGEIIHADADKIVLKTGGVGYVVYPVSMQCQKGESAALWIHDLVREDKRDLYGFKTQEAKTLFEQLISINGVGHKMAMHMLNSTEVSVLRNHIVEGNLDFLTSLSGVGKKTAQKIILEMKGVLVEKEEQSAVSKEVMDGLRSLGYAAKDVEPYLTELPNDTEKALKEVLKRIAKNL